MNAALGRLCAAPREEMPEGLRYVWVAYSGRAPYLPVAVADTAKELAAIVGVSGSCVRGCWLRYRRGQCCRSRYHKVLLEESKGVIRP